MRRHLPGGPVGRRIAVSGLIVLAVLALLGAEAVRPRTAAAITVNYTKIDLPGPAADVGVGPGGEVWITLQDDRIFRWNGASFDQTDGAATRVAVGPNGVPVVISRAGNGYIRAANGWAQMPAIVNATDVGFGANGDIVYANATGDALKLTDANNASSLGWSPVFGPPLTRVAVGPTGTVYAISGTTLMFNAGANWSNLPGQVNANTTADVGVGANGAIWKTQPDDSIWSYVSKRGWDQSPGAATTISVGPDGSPWVINRAGELFRGAVVAPPANTPTPVASQTVPQTVPAGAQNRPVLALLCTFADNAATFGITAAQEQAAFVGNPSYDGWVREMSYGAINFAGSQAAGWFPLPKARATYLNGDGQVDIDAATTDCVSSAQAAQVDLTPFYYVAVFLNDVLGNNLQGQQTIETYQVGGQPKRMPTVMLGANGLLSPPLVLHEFGHAFGGNHTTSRVDPLGGGSYLGDNPLKPKWPLPLKSANFGPGYNAYNRDLMGWIPAARKVRVTGGTQQITLARLTQPGPNGALLVQIPFGTNGGLYTVEVRTRIGYDAATAYPDFQVCAGCFSALQFGFVIPTEGVYIHRIDNPNADPASAQVLSTPGGDPSTAAGVWLPGQTYTDAANGISIAVNSFDQNGAQVTVTAPAATQ